MAHESTIAELSALTEPLASLTDEQWRAGIFRMMARRGGELDAILVPMKALAQAHEPIVALLALHICTETIMRGSAAFPGLAPCDAALREMARRIVSHCAPL